jgi:peptidoglycan/xylan/chitin deacetylase (PgdA/CDA1 family)
MKKASVIVVALAIAVILTGYSYSLSKTRQAVQPLSNNASNGRVVFTFDDGPDIHTPALLAELQVLHLRAVFFVIGDKIAAHSQMIRAEVADGDVVADHTWDHQSFTGGSTHSVALSDAEVKAELERTEQAIVAAGAPKPTLYRPPFGDITGHYNDLAAALGLRIVMPYEVLPTYTPRIVDSMDWTGISAQQIVSDVTKGYVSDGVHYPGIDGGSIIAMHESAPGKCMGEPALCGDALQTIAALPGIVAYMNAHHLGMTVDVPLDATGHAVPNMPIGS